MLLENEFEVGADLESTWTLLTDLERIMPCMPGASLDGRDGDTYRGNVKIKVGPIGAHFAGTASFAEKDDANHSAVIAASGKDPRGQATAAARVHARLEPVSESRTRVVVRTDLDITGKMAQFGRGAIADVSNRLIGQFVANLGALIEQGGGAPSSAASASAPSAPSATAQTSPAAVSSVPAPAPAAAAPAASGEMDVMALVLPMIKERYGQAIVGALTGFALSWAVFGRKVRK